MHHPLVAQLSCWALGMASLPGISLAKSAQPVYGGDIDDDEGSSGVAVHLLEAAAFFAYFLVACCFFNFSNMLTSSSELLSSSSSSSSPSPAAASAATGRGSARTGAAAVGLGLGLDLRGLVFLTLGFRGWDGLASLVAFASGTIPMLSRLSRRSALSRRLRRSDTLSALLSLALPSPSSYASCSPSLSLSLLLSSLLSSSDAGGGAIMMRTFRNGRSRSRIPLSSMRKVRLL
mmetsp:Transcript_34654/g.67430  ORF Transcript_34654/g.67430 Transcript_34654/m.67430 type:complete len:233 (-) Transcript_34654:307-1005(-)